MLLGWLGVGHWLLYALGATATYSCLGHGLAQVEGFLPAFALGFLLTALPRRTQGAPPSPGLIAACALGVTVAAAAAVTEHEAVAQVAFVAVIVLLVAFAARRFATRAAGRRPPANFVLIPIGLLHGLAGAVLILVATLGDGPAWTLGLGQPLRAAGPLPVSRRRRRRAAGPPHERGGAAAGSRCLAGGAAARPRLGVAGCRGVRHLPVSNARDGSTSARSPAPRWLPTGSAGAARSACSTGPGLNRRLMWLALRLTPLGIALAGLVPDYRVPALHVTFIGGFGLMAFAVASHVAYSHLGLESLRDGRPAAVVLAGTGIGSRCCRGSRPTGAQCTSHTSAGRRPRGSPGRPPGSPSWVRGCSDVDGLVPRHVNRASGPCAHEIRSDEEVPA